MKRVCILGSAPKKLLLTETAIVTLICTTYLETAAQWKKTEEFVQIIGSSFEMAEIGNEYF